jgi:hypothetical protein
MWAPNQETNTIYLSVPYTTKLATGTMDIMTSATIDVTVYLEMPHMSSAVRMDNALR